MSLCCLSMIRDAIVCTIFQATGLFWVTRSIWRDSRGRNRVPSIVAWLYVQKCVFGMGGEWLIFQCDYLVRSIFAAIILVLLIISANI